MKLSQKHSCVSRVSQIVTQSPCPFLTQCLFVQGIVERRLCKPVPLCHLMDSAALMFWGSMNNNHIGGRDAHLPYINAELSCSADLHSSALHQLQGHLFHSEQWEQVDSSVCVRTQTARLIGWIKGIFLDILKCGGLWKDFEQLTSCRL